METAKTKALTRLLVTVDGTSSDEAVALAAKLVARSGAELSLVHVDEGRGIDLALGERLLAEECAALGVSGPRAIAWRRSGSSPVDEVLALAAELRVDLVVTGGHPKKRRLLAGSFAGEVVRRSPAPVLVVPATAPTRPPGEAPFSFSLVALDADDGSVEALHLAARFGGQLEALHAVPDPELGGSRIDAIEKARRELEARVRGLDLRARPHIIVGRLPEAIAEFAVGGDYDLVACGARGKPLPGGVAEALLDAVSCPVLIVRGA